jgi:hypothetical protein
VPDLLSPKALSVLIDRKPHLLRPLAEQILPRPASIGSAERLGVDLNSVSTAEDCRLVRGTVLATIARGELARSEAARIARGVGGPAAVRRLAE